MEDYFLGGNVKKLKLKVGRPKKMDKHGQTEGQTNTIFFWFFLHFRGANFPELTTYIFHDKSYKKIINTSYIYNF